MKLSIENVLEVFQKCLFTDEEVGAKTNEETAKVAKKVDGVVAHVGFNPVRLEENREAINELLDQLPASFHEKTGGGMSFLNACDDKDGAQWGEHCYMDLLFCLGMGIDRVEYCMPRDMWKIFPGGMPYLVVKEKR